MKHLAFLAAASALMAPATAEPAHAPSDDLSIQSMHNYTACVVDRVRLGSIHLLTLKPGSPGYRQQISRLAHGTSGYCAPGRDYRFSETLFSGGLAERLLTKTLNVAEFTSRVAYDPGKPAIEVDGPVDETGICVVRAEPAKTWAIFQTEPTSRQELEALQAIGSALADCVPAGTKVAFNKQGVRAMLAVASYRLAQPATPAQGS